MAWGSAPPGRGGRVPGPPGVRREKAQMRSGRSHSAISLGRGEVCRGQGKGGRPRGLSPPGVRRKLPGLHLARRAPRSGAQAATRPDFKRGSGQIGRNRAPFPAFRVISGPFPVFCAVLFCLSSPASCAGLVSGPWASELAPLGLGLGDGRVQRPTSDTPEGPPENPKTGKTSAEKARPSRTPEGAAQPAYPEIGQAN